MGGPESDLLSEPGVILCPTIPAESRTSLGCCGLTAQLRLVHFTPVLFAVSDGNSKIFEVKCVRFYFF